MKFDKKNIFNRITSVTYLQNIVRVPESTGLHYGGCFCGVRARNSRALGAQQRRDAGRRAMTATADEHVRENLRKINFENIRDGLTEKPKKKCERKNHDKNCVKRKNTIQITHERTHTHTHTFTYDDTAIRNVVPAGAAKTTYPETRARHYGDCDRTRLLRATVTAAADLIEQVVRE